MPFLDRDFRSGLYLTNIESKISMHDSTKHEADESMPQAPASYNEQVSEMQTHDAAPIHLLSPQPQVSPKPISLAPRADSRINLTGPTSQFLPPHLRWSGIVKTLNPTLNNKQVFQQAQIPPPPTATNFTTSAVFDSDKSSTCPQKVLVDPMEDVAWSCMPNRHENVGTPNCSPLPGVGSKTPLNALSASIAASSPGPSSSGSPTQIFPFHLRKTQVSSSLIHAKTAPRPDCTHIRDSFNPYSESIASPAGRDAASLAPHLRRVPAIPAENTKHDTDQKDSKSCDAKLLNHPPISSQLSKLESKPLYLPPHLRYATSNTKQFPDLTRPSANSTPTKTFSEQSSSTLGGVALIGTCKGFIGPKIEVEAAMSPPPQVGSNLAQLSVPNEEEDSNGWVQGTDDKPVTFTKARIYSDTSIKTHSTQKYGSDVWDEWADRRKPGPLKSLCVSDDDFEEDISTKKLISAALTKYPRDVIQLNSLGHDRGDLTAQEWNSGRAYVTEEFLNAYVKIWRNELPEEMVIVNMNEAGFKDSLPINVKSFMNALEHPETFPNISTDNRMKQENWTSESAIERRQKRRLNIARRRQRQKNSYFVPNMQSSIQPFDGVDVPAKPYIIIHIRPAAMKDVPGITAIYNQWVSNSFIPEDQHEVGEENIKYVLETARKGLYPFIVAIRGDIPVGGHTTGTDEVVGFAMVEARLGFGSASDGRSRSTASVQLYVHQGCLRHGIGGHLLDQLMRRISRLHVPFSNRDVWVNPTNDALYEQVSKRFHQIVVHRPIDKPADADFMWFDAFMKKYKIFESHRAIAVGRKPPPKAGQGFPVTAFLDIITYQHEAEIASYVEG